MSWFSKAVKGVDHAISGGVKGLGHLAEKAAPIVGLIPGVGTIAGGAIGGLGALAAGDGLSGALKYGLEGAASGFGGQLLNGAGGISGALSHIPGGTSIASILGGGGGIGGAIPDTAMGIGGGGTSLSSILGGAGKLLLGNGGQNALGVAQGINGIFDQKKSENYAKDALGAATGAWNAGAPLRAQGIQGLLNPQAPSLTNLQGIAGSLKAPTITPGTPQDTGSLDATRAQLAQLHAPSPVAVSQFTAPQRPTRTPRPTDQGNPYARTA